MTSLFRNIFTAKLALDAVGEWVPGMILIKETSALMEEVYCESSRTYKTGGRMDAILIPHTWEAPSYKKIGFRQGIIGIEVKIHRSDFLQGLRNGQFEKYNERLCGLYICTPLRVAKSSEIPKEYGHLVVSQRPGYGLVCVCRRHPKWKEVDISKRAMFKILWAVMNELYGRDRKRQDEHYDKIMRIKERGGNIIGRLLKDEIARRE